MQTRSTTIFLFVALLLILSACARDPNPVNHISLDFPHGELRLILHRDDGARLTYGALPAFQMIQDGTFDIDKLYRQLKTRVKPVVPSEERPGERLAGMVSFDLADGTRSDHLLYDAAFAQELFTTACENLVPEGDVEQGVVARACADRLTAPP